MLVTFWILCLSKKHLRNRVSKPERELTASCAKCVKTQNRKSLQCQWISLISDNWSPFFFLHNYLGSFCYILKVTEWIVCKLCALYKLFSSTFQARVNSGIVQKIPTHKRRVLVSCVPMVICTEVLLLI